MWKLLTIIFVLVISFTVNAQWSRTSGPEGISISSFAAINGIVYAGTETDGIYASTDDGISWFPLNSGIETKSISAIASLPGYLLAATFGNGVYRSTDNGQTWLAPVSGGNLFVTAMVVRGPYIFVGTGSNGVYRSTDSGATWSQLFGYYGILSMGTSNNKVFAAVYGFTLVTTDDGETWSEVNSLSTAAPWSFYSEGDLVIAGCVNEIYRSTNQGNSFTQIPLYFSFGIVNIYTITAIGSTLFMGTSYDGVYKSTDNGSTWTAANEGMGPKNVRAVISTESSSLIAGSHYVGVYRSTDMGTEWIKSMSGFPAGSTISTMLSTESGIFAGTRDGVYRTTDNGASWEELVGDSDTINYSLVRGLCAIDRRIFAGTNFQFNATVYKSIDNGTTWTRSGQGLPADLTFINGLTVSGNNIIAGTSEGVYYSSDEGASWHQASIPVQYIEDIASGEGYVYAIVQGIGIYRSADDGVSWSVALPSTIDYVSLAANNSYVYAGSFFEGLRYSPNFGSGWYSSSGFPAETSVFGIGPVGDGMVLAGTDLEPNWIYASFDYGGYFSPYSEGLGQWAIVEAFAVSDSFMFGGTDYNGVWRRLLPGIVPVELTAFTAEFDNNKVRLEWITSTETNNAGFKIYRLKINGKKTDAWKMIGFVNGKGTTTEKQEYSFIDNAQLTGKYKYRLKQIDYDGSFKYSEEVEIETGQIPVKFALEQNYPNPFNPTTTIEFSVPEEGNVNLTLFNTLGKKVITLVDEYKVPGNYKINFKAEGLSSGIYFYKLQSGNFSSIKKMVLMK
jgi:photosystem II stability/assembly factor-like uncharacterized protein